VKPLVLLAAAAVLTAPLDLWTQGPLDLPPRGYVAYYAGSRITVDGKLDDKAWRSAPWTTLFVDIEGDSKPKPRFDTRVKMLWDDKFLYVGAELREPHVWATLTEHDSVIFHDPDFEVFIDPDGDNHEYYEFEINARGTYWDLFLPKPYKDGGKADNSWEIPGLKSAVSVDGTINDPRDTDRGWTVELAFPWAVLDKHDHYPTRPRESGLRWRINFSRVEWPIDIASGTYQKPVGAREDNWVWSPQYVINMHRPETWGYVEFSKLKPGTATFTPDFEWPARQWLMQVYYAQTDFKKAHGRYATTFEELQVDLPSNPLLQSPTLTVDGENFTATIDIKFKVAELATRWSVRQDSLLTPVRRALLIGNELNPPSVR
jgi:cellulose/xylan binding protein with CBM9 domain